ncbi:flagellar hook protein FlgE [Helicobacter kayseriensis]|uniref:flagellar hook protein FlgE n=1 Tax=Helicobacter kayseriensis TaxID=2905877 RepID=UPI001E4B9564|nr:flagellar hook protein FlgE [Helicobacter kayseriensis]MCE3047394.1 flagellar hook protein FlgE [Helicobacter kayseriensis]MCE3048935.1 flagellar hook protein FlgE [Helicobacter kayseriensis]
MLRSLWSGVGGMQAHQVALDVESNNIANVNTVGFKYSRASFTDMLSQVSNAATSPLNTGLGGQNDKSIGLGVGIGATTKVFSQGSLQNTDVKSDLAIEGDGFFVVSSDKGVTQKFTRNGEFLFDANGNLVTTGGQVVQGWVRDSNLENLTDQTMFKVDNSGPAQGIQIDPSMVMPARSSSSISLRANLNSGRKIEQMESISVLDSAVRTKADGTNPIYDSKFKLQQNAEDMGVLFNSEGDAMALTEDQGIWVSYKNSQMLREIKDTSGVSTLGLNGALISFSNDSNASGISSLTAAKDAINAATKQTGVTAFIENGVLRLENKNELDGNENLKNIIITDSGTGVFANFANGDADITSFRYKYTTNNEPDFTTGQFKTTEQLRELMQHDANMVKNPDGPYKDSTSTVSVTVNQYGMFEILNKDDGNGQDDILNVLVTSYSSDNIASNVLFKDAMAALNTTALVEGGKPTTSERFTKAIHNASIDVFDSLGSKHNVRIEFYKSGPLEWKFRAIVPTPARLVGASEAYPNILEGGRVTFNGDGSLAGIYPPAIELEPQNGAKTPQRIDLAFGSNKSFDGLTSVDKISETYAIDQNGYQAGDLADIRFDNNGTLLGAFSNGRTLALAQVALANFANNAGLRAEGGNLFSQSSNSGAPTIGAPNTGKRGGISGSKLEMSNVDLSRSLTQLIVTQRGFQANSKTVTTSDQILNTLLALKQ